MIDLQADREQSYEAVRRTPSDVQAHLSTLVDVVVRSECQRAIELGVQFGQTTAALLYALGQTGGHLWSVDDERRFNLADPIWTFIEGDGVSPAVLTQLPTVVDLVLINTDHRYRSTQDEIRTYLSRVRPGGSMIFTGTEVLAFDHHGQDTEPPYPVRLAVDQSLPANRYQRLHFTHSGGLMIVTMP